MEHEKYLNFFKLKKPSKFNHSRSIAKNHNYKILKRKKIQLALEI